MHLKKPLTTIKVACYLAYLLVSTDLAVQFQCLSRSNAIIQVDNGSIRAVPVLH